MQAISMKAIGVVRSTRKKIEDDRWDTEKMRVELDANQFSEEALAGLSDFSHAMIIFYMDQVDPSKVERGAYHPRHNAKWPSVGIFAQRGKNRPNQIGTTICKIVRVEGRVVFIDGLDAIDGTPVLDIKPWVAEFGPRGSTSQPDWVTELMLGYWQSDQAR